MNMLKKMKLSLGTQVFLGLIIGLTLGYLNKGLGLKLEILGQAFIRLIQMVIVPLVFPLIVLGVATMKDTKSLGRLAFKTILYFEVLTTIIIAAGVFIAKITNVGANSHFATVDTAGLGKLATGIDLSKFLLEIIPNNVFNAFSQGKLLPIIFFGVFLGVGLVSIGDKAKPVLTFFEAFTQAMFKVIEYAISFAPVGVFGFMAFNVAKYGIKSLISLGQFVLVAYLGFFVIVLIILPLVALLFRVPYFKMLREIWDLVLLAFTTRSSEVALPPLIERLEKLGVSRSITSFVLPMGYSFNLDGASLYASLSVIFIAHVYNLPLTLGHELMIIGILMVLTKGIAGVPSAVMVVLLATANEIGLPPEGVALLMGIDFFTDMGRTAVNVIGNSLATLVIGKWENSFEEEKVLSPINALN
jgi:proton glutamate symport protein